MSDGKITKARKHRAWLEARARDAAISARVEAAAKAEQARAEQAKVAQAEAAALAGLTAASKADQEARTARREALKAQLAAAPRRAISIGDTMHIVLGTGCEAEVARLIKQGLARGDTVTEGNTSQWVDEEPIRDQARAAASGRASDAYTWSKDGNKIKVQRTLVTRDDKTGTISRRPAGTAWRTWPG